MKNLSPSSGCVLERIVRQTDKQAHQANLKKTS